MVSPAIGFAGVSVLTTESAGAGAFTKVQTWFVSCATAARGGKGTAFDGAMTAPQPVEPRAKAWFATVTGAHTVPTWPVRVKVSAAPGRKLRPAPLQANHVPPATPAGGRSAKPAGAP